ncbi:cytochrome family subfamily polypeptide 55 precursor [Stylonychia lemnae]|uniref:Cytochrome family subfamily polypeptide 55 n=1 Tax=Stylonychia lemnae TaxID=5949 RepID=A0A078AJ56_STYLE|nr:cytochrome family subfamily polypeptide 55 precursor [Stylonychia lemnae]|eukprot:CDW82254.1 cytochrome family subfamily polypeptide 55 precursor [Stylonychia lemnae]
MIIQTIIILGLAYLFYEKVFKFYYYYWFYRRQGIPSTPFPLPFIGNLIEVKKALDNLGPYSKTVLEDYWHDCFGEILPPVFSDHRAPNGGIVFSDPNYVEEIYTIKSKYIDKDSKFQRLFYKVFGDSSFLSKSNEVWATKRKHLSAAFYKDKINLILRGAVSIANQRVKVWKNLIQKDKQVVNLTKEMNELIDDVVQICIFGQISLKKQLIFKKNGQESIVSLGRFIRLLSEKIFSRYASLFRQFTDVFDFAALNKQEREDFENAKYLREFTIRLIDERRKEIEKPDFQSQGDFLTLILQDSYFEKDKDIIDEVVGFMTASNVTTSIVMTNAIFYLTKNQEAFKKVRDEFKKVLKVDETISSLTDLQWADLLTYENLNMCNYLNYCVNETMRIDPSSRVTTNHVFTENIQIGGISILSETPWQINIYALQNNPKEWIQPDQFIPERFDPLNPYYLTPAGTKRNSFSFGPFFGGKRICLGKTFAESLMKCLISIIVNQIDFEFEDKELLKRKPIFALMQDEPCYLFRLKQYETK